MSKETIAGITNPIPRWMRIGPTVTLITLIIVGIVIALDTAITKDQLNIVIILAFLFLYSVIIKSEAISTYRYLSKDDPDKDILLDYAIRYNFFIGLQLSLLVLFLFIFSGKVFQKSELVLEYYANELVTLQKQYTETPEVQVMLHAIDQGEYGQVYNQMKNISKRADLNTVIVVTRVADGVVKDKTLVTAAQDMLKGGILTTAETNGFVQKVADYYASTGEVVPLELSLALAKY